MTGQAGTEIQVRIHERQEHWAQRTGLSVPVLYSEDRIMYRPERIGLAERVVRRGRHFNLPEKANRSAL